MSLDSPRPAAPSAAQGAALLPLGSSALRTSRLGALLLICLAMVLAGLPTLLEPFGRDQAEYATIAEAFLRGQVIYRDVFNVKPPLTHLVHALALSVFGHSMLAIRLLDLIWQTATALLIASIGFRLSGRHAVGVAAALLYAVVYYATNSFWGRAQTDGFITLFIAASMLAFYQSYDRPRLRYLFVAGFAIGTAVLLKYPIGILAPLLGLLLVARFKWRGVGAMLILGISSMLPVLVAGAALWREGGLQEFLWIQLTYIPGYSGQSAGMVSYLSQMAVRLGMFLALHPIGLMTLVAGALLAVWPVPGAPGRLPLVMWLIAAVVHMAVQNKFYIYHGLPLIGVTAVVIAMAAVPALRHGLRRPVRFVVVALLLMALPAHFLWYTLPAQYATLLAVATGRQSVEAAYAAPQFSTGADFSSAANLEMARVIAERTAPGDTIFIWGFEPSVYFLSGRAPATRFIYNFPLYGSFPAPELRVQLLEQLEAAAPRYILVLRNDALPRVTGVQLDSTEALAGFAELRGYIDRNYTPDGVIEDFTLFRRVDS